MLRRPGVALSIPLQQARELVARLRSGQIASLWAQVHAKHVLHEVRELSQNFPAFDIGLDDKVTFSAYGLLAAGCSLIEQDARSEGADAVERASSLLHYAHGPSASASRASAFNVLVAAMGFYAAGHYSRAFVTMRLIEEQTSAARIVAAFIRKDVAAVIPRLNEVLLRDAPTFENERELDDWAITVAIARAVSAATDFVFGGAAEALAYADQQLAQAAVVASCGAHPSWWWVVRLLRLMLSDLRAASPWTIVPTYFPPGSMDKVGKYVRLQAFAKHPVFELWTSQRSALPLALNGSNGGGIINLRTSAGKTRVAELAILQTLEADPDARVFYLAPFRSLAIEVELALSSTFSWLGYGVSHLYGGSRVSSVDAELAAESAITIATPEKARALLRAAPDVFDKVKLLIIDEGHLVGASERFVRNEVFVDHLRALARATGARLLLLSAVLPNPHDLAEWVAGDRGAVAISSWKPSAERFALLRWNGSRVRIDWRGDVASFNPSFVEAKPLGFGRRKKPFPSDKNEAVAASAVRLSAVGPVMIFSGRAASVSTLAADVLLALGENPSDHGWPEHEWRVFEAVCREELEPDAVELRAARAGVVCHSNRLTPQVRLAVEHLMRSLPPKIIIATTTLGQGVNVGISSVIVATPYIGKETIDKRDFWNICGRAGRAFVDGEGKILYAIDDTRERWQIQRDERLAEEYFSETGGGERVESGLLFVVRALRDLASQVDLDFAVLLELAANNDFSALGSNAKDAEELCDLFDDQLLALHSDLTINPTSGAPEQWVEHVFRSSLAAIQASALGSGVAADDVLALLRARVTSALRRVPSSAQHAVVSSGLPMSVAIRLNQGLQVFEQIAESCAGESVELADLARAVRATEEWVRSNASSMITNVPSAEVLEMIRADWIAGIGLQDLSTRAPGTREITKNFYGYQLPWIIHAASQQLRSGDNDSASADVLSRLALLIELGVPSERAARVFLAGVRSRESATELASLELDIGTSVAEISRELRDPRVLAQAQSQVSASTASWLELMVADGARRRSAPVPAIPPFTIVGAEAADVLHARRLGEQVFLMSRDGTTRIAVKVTEEFPFDRVADDPRVAFGKHSGVWRMRLRDPRLEPRDHSSTARA